MEKWKDVGIADTFTKYVMTFGFFPSDGLATGSWFDVRRCKMEFGNKATDWCPAPDDAEFEITALKTRCSTIEQTAEDISQTVTNVQTNLSNNYSTTTQMQSAINAKAEEINLSVNQTIDGISIGTRNLVLNSSGNLGNTSNWSPTTDLTVSIRTDDGIYGQNSIHLVPPKGASSRSMLRQTVTNRLGMSDMTNVTLSFWYRAASSSTSSGVGALLRLTNDSGGTKDVLVSTGKLTLDWKWRKYTATVDLSNYAGTYTGAILHLCAFGGSVRYSCIKLESGNKPSDWTPAPEDSDTKFSLVQTQIGSKVDKNDYNQIISMINLATDDIMLGGNLTSEYQGFKTTLKSGEIDQLYSGNLVTAIKPQPEESGWKTGLISEQSGTGIMFGQRKTDNSIATYYQMDTNASYDTYRHRFFGNIKTDSGISIGDSCALKIGSIDTVKTLGGDIYVGTAGVVLRLIGSSVTSNGSAVTSDRRMKNSIADIDEKYLKMLDVLSAKTFRYNQHRPEIQNCGFIAQDVLSALDNVGLTAKEFGGFVDVNGDGSEFALDYSQFIPILWAAVQDIKSKLNGDAQSIQGKIN